MVSQVIALIAVLILISAAVVLLENPFSTTQQIKQAYAGAEAGKLAPDFSLESLDGKRISLSEYRGKKTVLVNFWASWCGPCKEEMPAFQKLWEEQKEKFEIIGVNLQESKQKAIDFAKELNITYPLALDPNSQAKRAYNAIVQPVSLLVSRNGTIIFRRNGILSEEEIFGMLKQLIEEDAQAVVPQPTPTPSQEKQFALQQALEPINASEEVTVTNELQHLKSFKVERVRAVLPADGIPAIDKPKFVSAGQASHVKEDERILGIEFNGVAKAYPYSIMVWHEIANDFFGEVPLLITYCPLCGTGIVFHRTINGEAVEFGTSGSLYNSNLLMYDRKTNSLWYQVSAKAVAGELAGLKLRIIPSEVVLFREWKKKHPDSLVLTRETGHSRNYDSWPYGNYDENNELLFPVETQDERLHIKALVQGVELNGIAKAYPHAEVEKAGVVNDEVGGIKLLIAFDNEIKFPKIFVRAVDGKTLSFRISGGKLISDDGSEWSFEGTATTGALAGKSLERVGATTAMWFSWLNIHPQTLLFKAP